jgi:hypothetical protein
MLLDDDGRVTSVDVGAAGYRLGDVGSLRVLVASRVLRDVAPDVRTEPAAGTVPDVVVLVERDVADPAAGLALVTAGLTHLSVVVREADALVGPLVVPGAGPCLRCVDLHRGDVDDCWPTVAAQLAGRATGAGRSGARSVCSPGCAVRSPQPRCWLTSTAGRLRRGARPTRSRSRMWRRDDAPGGCTRAAGAPP